VSAVARRFVANEILLYIFSLSSLKKIRLVLLSTDVLTIILIILIFNFCSRLFYKKIFVFNSIIHSQLVIYFFFNLILILLIYDFFTDYFVKVLLAFNFIIQSKLMVYYFFTLALVLFIVYSFVTVIFLFNFTILLKICNFSLICFFYFDFYPHYFNCYFFVFNPFI
jgi:hypothetical protein